MVRKASAEAGTREEIITAATACFFEKGFDGTSVRAVMKRVGAEAGLFYYYFSSKDEVFDIAVKRFTESYRRGFEEVMVRGRQAPREAMSDFFEFIRVSTSEFRVRYADKLHWSMRRAIREQALEMMEPYLEQIIDLLIGSGMPAPPVERRVLAVILARGIGSVILSSESDAYAAALPEMKKAVRLLLGSPPFPEDIGGAARYATPFAYRIIRLIDEPWRKDSMAAWFHAKWGIPEEAYRESMEECLSGRAAVPQWYCVMAAGEIAAGIGVIENDFHDRTDLSPNVCAVYVEKKYRGRGIAGQLLDFVCADMQARGIDTLYLLTDHTSFYERYGWQFNCMAKNDGEDTISRLYIHRQ